MDLRAGLHRFAFVFVLAAIASIGSERMFWFWAADVEDHLVVTLVYAVPVAGFLYALDRFRARSVPALIVALPIFGYLVEGVITPVMYSGGPFVPFFPAWFGFWHGLLAMGTLVFAFRYWLLADRRWALLAASAGLGLFWGTWSATLWLPENLEDPELIADSGGPLHVLGPAEFAGYVTVFAAILALGHYLLGRGLWLTSYRPSRVLTWAVMALVGAVLAAYTVGNIWALPMFAVYVGGHCWVLRRHGASTTGPTLLARLDGHVPARRLVPLAALPVAAAMSYAIWWEVRPADVVLRALMYSIIGLQAVAGLLIVVGAGRRSLRENVTNDLVDLPT